MAEPASEGASPPAPEVTQKAGLAEHYAALEAALNVTPRGRWFLAEYARRNRTAETDMLLEAIARLEAAVLKPQRQQPPAGILAELKELSEAIARTRREIGRIRPPHQLDKDLVGATEELDSIVAATERATSDILEAAEDIQEVAWTMREKSIELALCDRIDRRATEIYTACSFQDITGQRTAKVVRTLRFVEQRINAMIASWGGERIAGKVDDIAAKMETLVEAASGDDAPLLNGPQRIGEGLQQDEVDRMLTGRETAAPQPTPASAGDTPLQPLSRLDERETPGFARPNPLIFAELDVVKRATLFG